MQIAAGGLPVRRRRKYQSIAATELIAPLTVFGPELPYYKNLEFLINCKKYVFLHLTVPQTRGLCEHRLFSIFNVFRKIC